MGQASKSLPVSCGICTSYAVGEKNKNIIYHQEEEELIAEWMPEPLVPNPPPEDHPALHTRTVYGKVVTHKVFGIISFIEEQSV